MLHILCHKNNMLIKTMTYKEMLKKSIDNKAKIVQHIAHIVQVYAYSKFNKNNAGKNTCKDLHKRKRKKEKS